MRIEYNLEQNSIPEYCLRIMKSSVCPALMPAGYLLCEDHVEVSFDPAGYTSLYSFLELAVGTMNFPKLLSMLRRIAEAVQQADRYLIKSNFLSLNSRDIYFDSKQRAVLLLKPAGRDFLPEFIQLCTQLSVRFPALNADLAAEKIAQENSRALLSMNSLLRLLSAWELEMK